MVASGPSSNYDEADFNHGLLGDTEQLPLLTSREQEIPGMLLSGLRVAAIADELHIAPSTLRNHLKSIFQKMDVYSLDELMTNLKSKRDNGS